MFQRLFQTSLGETSLLLRRTEGLLTEPVTLHCTESSKVDVSKGKELIEYGFWLSSIIPTKTEKK